MYSMYTHTHARTHARTHTHTHTHTHTFASHNLASFLVYQKNKFLVIFLSWSKFIDQKLQFGLNVHRYVTVLIKIQTNSELFYARLEF